MTEPSATTFIGMDVSKNSIAIALLRPGEHVPLEQTIATPTANSQFWMHSKFFLQRQIAGTYPGSDWVYAYVSTQTNVWWTRDDTNYDVFAGEQTNT